MPRIRITLAAQLIESMGPTTDMSASAALIGVERSADNAAHTAAIGRKVLIALGNISLSLFLRRTRHRLIFVDQFTDLGVLPVP
jgi:hypothetical protein